MSTPALAVLALSALAPAVVTRDQDPLCDWSPWTKYRAAITHPAGVIKPAGLDRARRNLERYEWARKYLAGLTHDARSWVTRLTPEFLATMVPVTTPGDTLFTPCPACRDLRQPFQSHGQWKWAVTDPEHLTCAVCGTVFPNDRYPESLSFATQHARVSQTLTFYGGEPLPIFGFPCRPSFTANIRARKVGLMSGVARRLAEAYALSGDPAFAQATRAILLRFAEVYPGWLVHVGYGEYADCDPCLAALNIASLPEPEITPVPAGPDRRLHSGFWQGGRATGTGMEGGFVRQIVEAYTLTCTAQHQGQPIYSADERLRIERDLLLESTILLVADKALNNKSVTNATATALVGMTVGHPGLVRFGLDLFRRTVDGWFLADGGTSESWSYATMTLGGIEALGQACQGYSDPPGYRDAAGDRIEHLDLYRDTPYGRVWEAMFQGLQGDLRYPPLADGHRTTALGANWVELLAANYRERPEYLALLKEMAGADLSRSAPGTALYCREPGLEQKVVGPLTLTDHRFPVLGFGQLRSGPTGRDGLVVLSASDWGGHHHLDSLNLYYWQHGQELLSDLGYLWDHPRARMTSRTLAHNTVVVDAAEQVSKGRGGSFTLFETKGPVKVMEAESKAYAQASLYRRTVAQIEVGPGRWYLLDLFRVQGGQVHDYVWHGPNRELAVSSPALAPVTLTPSLDLTQPRGATTVADWSITWALPNARAFTAKWANAPGETSLVADGWGQRDYRNADVGAVLPYLVRRRRATPQPSVFVTVYEGHPAGQPLVRSLRLLAVPGDDAVAAACIELPDGQDIVVSSTTPHAVTLDTGQGTLEFDGRFGLVRLRAGQPAETFGFAGQRLNWQGR